MDFMRRGILRTSFDTEKRRPVPCGSIVHKAAQPSGQGCDEKKLESFHGNG